MPIRCLIIDDEPLSVRIVEKYAAQHPQLELVGVCGNAIEGMEYLNQQPVDLMFLDINMPELSGIGLMKSLINPPMVIFISAHAEYAVAGFDLAAVDYLLKPFSFDRFSKAITKVMERLSRSEGKNITPADGHILLKADKKFFRVEFSNLVYLTAYGDYVKVFTRERMLVVKTRLSQLESQLPSERFMRIHRSSIISLDKIDYLEGNQVNIGGEILPIGASFKETLMNWLEQR